MRTVGHNPRRPRLCRHLARRIIIIAMLISGALAGMMALNEIMGDQHRLVLDFAGGSGFVGIAVALMGRSTRSASCWPRSCSARSTRAAPSSPSTCRQHHRDMIVVIQGLVILFAGALEHMFRPGSQALFACARPAARCGGRWR